MSPASAKLPVSAVLRPFHQTDSMQLPKPDLRLPLGAREHPNAKPIADFSNNCFVVGELQRTQAPGNTADNSNADADPTSARFPAQLRTHSRGLGPSGRARVIRHMGKVIHAWTDTLKLHIERFSLRTPS